MAIITFSEDMHIVPDLKMIEEGTVEIGKEQLPVFKVEVIAGEDSDPSRLLFTWHIVEMTERKIFIQMVFNEAIYVSAKLDAEILRVTFVDKYTFVGRNNLPIEMDSVRLRHL